MELIALFALVGFVAHNTLHAAAVGALICVAVNVIVAILD